MVLIFSISLIGLAILFLWLFSSSLGVPLGIATMIAVGSLAHNVQSLILVILVSFVAVVIGDITAYEIARRLSDPFLNKLRKFSFFNKGEPQARRLLYEYEFWIVFLTRFLFVNLCAVVSYISGLQKLNRRKFLRAVIPGEFLYALIYSSIGFLLGEAVNNIIITISDLVWIVVLAALVLYLIVVGFIKIRKRRLKRKMLLSEF